MPSGTGKQQSRGSQCPGEDGQRRPERIRESEHRRYSHTDRPCRPGGDIAVDTGFRPAVVRSWIVRVICFPGRGTSSQFEITSNPCNYVSRYCSIESVSSCSVIVDISHWSEEKNERRRLRYVRSRVDREAPKSGIPGDFDNSDILSENSRSLRSVRLDVLLPSSSIRYPSTISPGICPPVRLPLTTRGGVGGRGRRARFGPPGAYPGNRPVSRSTA